MTDSHEVLQPPTLYGMREQDLNDDIWRGVVKIYYETTGGSYVPDENTLTTRFFVDDALNNRFGEFRYGSRFSVHSKLRIKDVTQNQERFICFDFDPNVDREELDPATTRGQEIASAREDFRQQASDFLFASGVGHPIE